MKLKYCLLLLLGACSTSPKETSNNPLPSLMTNQDKTDFMELAGKYINTREYEFFGGRVEESALMAYEDSIGFKLPDDFKDFLMSPIGGIVVEVKEDIWPAPVEGSVGEFWTFIRGLKVYTIHPEAPEYLQIGVEAQHFKEETGLDYYPFMQLYHNADLYVFDSHQTIYQWDHETNEVEKVDMKFTALLEMELQELNERKEKYIKEVRDKEAD
jgi:hypothetical protein